MMYERREYVEQGGLVSYAPDTVDQFRRAGGYVVIRAFGAHCQKPTLTRMASGPSLRMINAQTGDLRPRLSTPQ